MRDFAYKRSHNGAHLALAARYSPTLPVTGDSAITSPASQASAASDPKKTPDPLTPIAPPTTADTPTASSSPTPSPSSAPTTSSASSLVQALSSTPTSSASASISSATPKSSAATSTPLVATPVITPHTSLGTSLPATGISLTPTSSHSPSTTSTTGTSSGTNTGVVVGAIAGTLAGIAILGFLLKWCMRRQRNRDVDDFDAQAFKRQSAILVDDPVEPPRSYGPRAPSMIEHHNVSPALATQAGYGGQNFYGNYGGYGQQPSNAPLEMIQSAGSPPPQAYGAPPMGYAGYNDPQHQIARQPSNVGYAGYNSLARQPSNAQYLTRQPSPATRYAPVIAPPGSLDANASYIDLNRSSVSPYQAAQYADISRQLGATDPNGQVPHDSRDLPEGPLPSPFDDPVEATPVQNITSPHVHTDHPSDVAAPGPVTATSAPQSHENAAMPHQRPATVYEEGDAYGGI